MNVLVGGNDSVRNWSEIDSRWCYVEGVPETCVR